MKNMWSNMWNVCSGIALAGSAFMSGGGFALTAAEPRRQVFEQSFEVTKWQDVTSSYIEEFLSSQRPEWVVEWHEGMLLPVSFNLSGDFFVQVPDPTDGQETGASGENRKPSFYLHTTGHFYARYINDTFLFSDDLKVWTPWNVFFTGELCAQLKAPEEGAEVTLTLHRRGEECEQGK